VLAPWPRRPRAHAAPAPRIQTAKQDTVYYLGPSLAFTWRIGSAIRPCGTLVCGKPEVGGSLGPVRDRDSSHAALRAYPAAVRVRAA